MTSAGSGQRLTRTTLSEGNSQPSRVEEEPDRRQASQGKVSRTNMASTSVGSIMSDDTRFLHSAGALNRSLSARGTRELVSRNKVFRSFRDSRANYTMEFKSKSEVAQALLTSPLPNKHRYIKPLSTLRPIFINWAAFVRRVAPRRYLVARSSEKRNKRLLTFTMTFIIFLWYATLVDPICRWVVLLARAMARYEEVPSRLRPLLTRHQAPVYRSSFSFMRKHITDRGMLIYLKRIPHTRQTAFTRHVTAAIELGVLPKCEETQHRLHHRTSRRGR